jgi:hypothetical protein
MMSEYIEMRGRPTGVKPWLKRFAIGIAMLSFVGAVVWGGMNLSHGPSAAKRQVARIVILPDTPPPPPPPEEKRPPPKEEQPRQQVETPKLERPPGT